MVSRCRTWPLRKFMLFLIVLFQAKAEGKKLKKVSIKVTPHGIKVQDMATKEVYVISDCVISG